MTNQRSVVKVHLLNRDNPGGPRILQLTHANSLAIASPRLSWSDVRLREEFAQPAVYLLLLGRDPITGRAPLYVGQTDFARDRLDHWDRNPDTSWADWVSFVDFTSRDGTISHTHVEYLEARLIKLGKSLNPSEIVNPNTPSGPTVDETEQTISENFLQDVLIYCTLLGIGTFESPIMATSLMVATGAAPSSTVLQTSRTPQPGASASIIYSLQKGLTNAAGAFTTDGGFLVLAESVFREEAAPARDSRMSIFLAKRDEMVRSGAAVAQPDHTYKLARDVLFDSPSGAAGTLLGYPVSGVGEDGWRDPEGKTINDRRAHGLPV
jgi:hypothetical protein